MVSLEVRRVHKLVCVSVRFSRVSLFVVFLVAKAFDENFCVACAFSSVLDDADIFDFAAAGSDLLQDWRVALAKEVFPKEFKLLKAQSVL